MSTLNNSLLLTQEDTGYSIRRSLRFDGGGGLSRTLGTPTLQTAFTFSTWVKRSSLGGLQYLLGGAGANNEGIYFNSSDTLSITNGNIPLTRTLNLNFKDATAWYHIVVAHNGTASLTVYVNGVSYSLSAFTSSSFSSINRSSTNYVGTFNSSASFLNGYLADTHMIDGEALTASSFGEFDANGEWQPKQYTGTYGNNGYRLNYGDNSGTTATTLGADSSGRANHFTPSGFSVAAGVGNDSLTDTPTSFGVDSGLGGQVRGNYATLNSLNSTVTSVVNGALDYTATTASTYVTGTIGMRSGKWYWEVYTSGGTTQTEVGVATAAGVSSARFALPADLTVYGIRFDADAGTLDRTSDGTTWTSIATGLTSRPYVPYFFNSGTTAKTVSVNFGQRPFNFTAPTGYKVLCDTTTPTAPIAKATTVIDKVLYTGTGAALTPTSALQFSPDFVWIKQRNTTSSHALYDALRGATIELQSESTAAETTQSQGLTTFNSNGFSVGTLNRVNTNAATYAAFCWDTGSSNVSNTSGTISSTVRANASAGFSIVTYTGNGTSGATIGHGLGAAPTWIMIKSRTSIANWNIYTTALDGTLDFFAFTTTAKTDSAEAVPTSSVFSVSNGANVNANGTAYVAYCWTPVAGISQSFTYTGNGAANGPFIYTGFRPQFALFKQATAASTTNWVLAHDASNAVSPSTNAAEFATAPVTFAASGIKILAALADYNANAGSFVGYAWSEFPFQYSRAN